MKRLDACLLLVLASLFAGCANMSPRMAAAEAQPTTSDVAGMPSVRMLVWEASLTLEVRSIQTAAERIHGVTKAQGGHLDASSSGQSPWGDAGAKSAAFTIRVPFPVLRDTIAQLKPLGRVVHEEVSSKDVTAACIDMQAQFQNKTVLRDRLKLLLAKAESVQDVLAIEKELARVQTEIDSLDGRLKGRKDKVGMATLNVYLSRRKILGPLGYVYKGISWTVEKLFVLRR